MVLNFPVRYVSLPIILYYYLQAIQLKLIPFERDFPITIVSFHLGFHRFPRFSIDLLPLFTIDLPLVYHLG